MMVKFSIFLLVIIVCCCSNISATGDSLPVDLDQKWNEFKRLYNRNYASADEHQRRRDIFEENLRFITEHNRKDSFKLAVNRFADRTREEYGEWIRARGGRFRSGSDANTDPVSMVNDVPFEVDWEKSGMVTPVQNQGETGASWAFSAITAMESEHAINSGELIPLSIRQLTKCSNATNMDDAFQYVINNNGIDQAGTFTGPCNDDHGKVAARFRSIGHVKRGDETSLQVAVARIGPVSVAIDASSSYFQFYHSGIFDHSDCRSDQLDHAVAVVGYGSTAYGADYWKVKNSWGTEWGVNGYIFMARNKDNQCGIASMASYPIVV